jgi:hypothetical protein
MPRQDTRLESEGAEFLTLGQLLLNKIASYKTYTNMPGYDIVATNPEEKKAARIQVKSRWRTKAPGFLIKNFDCDFAVAVLLNRGSKAGTAPILPPQYYVIPTPIVKAATDTGTWSKVFFKDIAQLPRYEEAWGLIDTFLKSGRYPKWCAAPK